MNRMEHSRLWADRLVFVTEEALLKQLETLNGYEAYQKVYDHFLHTYPDVPQIARNIKLYAELKGIEIKGVDL